MATAFASSSSISALEFARRGRPAYPFGSNQSYRVPQAVAVKAVESFNDVQNVSMIQFWLLPWALLLSWFSTGLQNRPVSFNPGPTC